MNSPILCHTRLLRASDADEGHRWYWALPLEEGESEGGVRPLIVQSGMHVQRQVLHWTERSSPEYWLAPAELRVYFGDLHRNARGRLHRLSPENLEMMLTDEQREELSDTPEPVW